MARSVTLVEGKGTKFAEEARALGWDVELDQHKDGTQEVLATQGVEYFNFKWVPNGRGGLNFKEGFHALNGEEPEEWSNLKAALRLMAEPVYVVNGEARRLPFDPENEKDADVISAIAGNTVVWVNSISGQTESAFVLPSKTDKAGKVIDHNRIEPKGDGARRAVTFCSMEGFRTVRLDAIVEVKS